MDNRKFYDGTKLLNEKDIDGNTPEIFLVESNRSDGKTTWFIRFLVNRFKEHGEKFMVLYRFNYEITDCAEKVFGGLKFFPENEGDTYKSIGRMKNLYSELYINNKCCGYAVSLNSADKLKTASHVFNDVSHMFMDEFQSETDHYCTDEVQKLLSIHSSAARSYGQHTRYLPLYMASNYVTILNPYYYALGITPRLNKSVKWLHGKGWVLHCNFNEEAAKSAVEGSTFNKAFANTQSNYIAYLSERNYLNDDNSGIEPNHSLTGMRYVFTLKDGKELYSVWTDEQILFVTNRGVDKQWYRKYTTGLPDGEYISVGAGDLFILNLRTRFRLGVFRFRNINSRNALIALIRFR